MLAPNRPTGTVTFLFTDMEDGANLPGNSPQALDAAVAGYDDTLRRAIEANGGYVYKQVGRALQVAFATAPEAARAALAAQRAVVAEERAAHEETAGSPVRMALHTGVTEEREGDYFGPLLNRVARMLAAGHGGQVLVSTATWQLLAGALPEGVSLRDLGEHRLRDLTRPEHIFQLLAPGLPAEFPPLNTLDTRLNNLPLQPTPFVGRDKEVAEVATILRRDDVTLLSLTGVAGVGKTRLALQVAAELLDDFRDGVFFVSLAPITDPNLVFPTVAQTIGVREAGGRPILDTLKDHLRDRRVLLLLDNFEQVLDAAPALSEVLTSSSRLKVLVTSRAALRLSMEHEYSVPPLALPDLGRLPDLQVLTQYEAVELFIARAQTARPGFEVNNANAPAVAEICYRLDGLPLAIELAAARVRVLSPQDILARLSSRLRLLTGGGRDLPARQQTLRSAIEWSYDLLDQGEQALFKRLAVFSGGGSLEAIEAVVGDRDDGRWTMDDGRWTMDDGGEEGVRPTPSSIVHRPSSAARQSPIVHRPSSAPELDVLDGLSSLIDKSLVYQRAGWDDEPRFFMLETIREYARARLDESGDGEAPGRLHAGYFLDLAERAEPELTGAGQEEWLSRLEEEHDNLRAALEWYLGRGETEPAGRLAGALWRFWYRHGHLTEGRRWLALVLANAEALSPPTRAKARHGAGVMAYEQGDYDEARASYQESLALRRELGDKKGMVASLNNLANVTLLRGEYEQAERFYLEALDLSRELGDAWSIYVTLGNIGWVAMNQGDYERAASRYEESLAMRRAANDKWAIANALDNLAWARVYQGRYALADRLAAEGMVLFQELGDKDSISDVLDIQGRAALGLGDVAQARELLKQSLALSRELGDKGGIALALSGLAATALADGEPRRAAVLFGGADALRASTAAFQRVYFERYLSEARARMDAETWESAVAEGRAMNMEQAVEYALAEK